MPIARAARRRFRFHTPALALAVVVAAVLSTVAPMSSVDAADALETRSVSGVVSLPAGVPAEWLAAVQVSASSGSSYKSSAVDPVTGAYTIADVEPGSYRVQFSVNQYWDGAKYVRPNLVSEYFDEATNYSDATPVDVTMSSAADIDADLALGRTISGRVTLPEGAEPAWLSAISVRASASNGGSGYTQLDPATGEYSITGLAPGDYRVQFNVGQYWDGSRSVRPNLVSEYYDDVTDWGSATTVDVLAGDRSGINAALEPGRSITGTVVLPEGAPSEWLRSVSVSASSINGSMIGGLSATPDPIAGQYTITGLAPGSYQVAFRVMSGMPGTEIPNLVDEYYDNAYSLSTATPVDVTGADMAGIDAALESGRSISGTVTLPADAPTEWRQGIGVSAMTPTGDQLGYGNNVKLDPATGAYTYSRLPAGEFVVYFSASGYPDGSSWAPTDIAAEYYDKAPTRAEATLVSTTAGDVTGIDAQLQHGGGIEMDLDVSALLGTGTGIGISITDLPGNVLTSYGDPMPQDGRYQITVGNLTPGSYRIAVTTSTWDEQTDEATIASTQFLRFGSGTSVNVTAGHTITGPVTARAADATISGNIRAEGFTSTGDILGSVMAYERLEGDWIRLPDVRFDTTQNGATPYSLAIPSGTYTVGYETDHATTGIDVQEQWWSGRSTLATADAIALTANGTHADTNGSIRPADYVPVVEAPSPPREVAAIPGDGTATVSWSAPDSDGGAPISQYTVRADPGGKTVSTSGVRSAVFTGLQNGTGYAFTVVATNTSGKTSQASTPSSTVTPQAQVKPPITFTDTAGHTFAKEIAWLAETGATRGWQVGENTFEFRPQQQILRAEMAAFLYRLAGSPDFSPTAESPFIDVPTTHTFYKEILWLASTGISRGWDTPNGVEFRPQWPTSREVMAAFLYRYQDQPAYSPDGESPFTDVIAGSNVFHKEIMWLASQGISTGWDIGYGCREYRPSQNVLRAEMAAFIYRMENGGGSPLDVSTCAPPPSPLISGSVTAGAFCAQQYAGWYGYTSTGRLMRCETSPTDSRLRWREV
jgi:5-hydroxyisourate hydrolase-like protein (transthyretin family)